MEEAEVDILRDGGYVRKLFKEFLRSFLDVETKEPIYRNQLVRQYNVGKYFIVVRVEDLKSFNEKLGEEFVNDPSFYTPFFETAAKEAFFSLQLQNEAQTMDKLRDIQVCFSWNERQPYQIRQLTSVHISKLVSVTGIVINASRTTPKARELSLLCKNCQAEKCIHIKPGFSGAPIPSKCENSNKIDPSEPDCPPNSFIVNTEKCKFVDHQSMKLQESPETIPTGEMPRHVILSCENFLVERASPGTRINIIGIYSTFQGNKSINADGKSGKKQVASATVRYPYIRVLGVQINNQGSGRADMQFSKEEEAEFIKFSKRNAYDVISQNIDPAIYGHEDIKKAITCLLFGGSTKFLPDGIRRRGDINVLLLGDPSTAKSQLLKFTEKVAPIGVYTSGKGSSAAGLTACIIKEPGTGEYYLEGGSMVLADGGIVCIDEFDKMREQDRVAIHEAMEQQTISIAKAGITTVLNSRTSVLAAANPIFGRYDDLKSAEEQIDFQTTILSRFDMIFIVKDVKNPKQDEMIAKHVIKVHMHRKIDTVRSDSELDLNFIKRYISYCRNKCSPRISTEAIEMLKNFYVNQRSKNKATGNKTLATIPITVRQLEALVRISESLAKMNLLNEATEQHAQEAIRLFSISTVSAINSGEIPYASALEGEEGAEISKVEEQIKLRLPLHGTINQENLVNLLQRNKFQRYHIERTLYIMAQRGEIEFKNQRRTIKRLR